jgi:Fe-S-cluster-containing dehydrogenase component
MRYAMVIDTKLCVGCMTCVIACATENDVPPRLRRDWITETERADTSGVHLDIHSQRCNHCDTPPCVPVCPADATSKRADGIVVVNQKACIGCGACVEACPYGARFLHPDGYASKCTYCAHLLDQGGQPECVTACPTSCITFGDLDDPNSAVSQLLRARPHHVLKPETGIGPRGYYLT